MNRTFTLLSFLFAVIILAVPTDAQRRDYFTDEEIEIVRDSPVIDKRIDALTKMIDRRFSAIGIDAGGWKPKPKDPEVWGDLGELTRSRGIFEIRSIVQKAADDIDDIAGRNEHAIAENKMSGKFFPKAVRAMAAACGRYLPLFAKAEAESESPGDRGNLQTSAELCEAIVEAVKKL